MNKDIFMGRIVNASHKKDIIKQLKNSPYPVVLWGAGSLAHNVKKILQDNGITICCCWVDDAFAQQEYEGIPIKNIEEIEKSYAKINLVFGHSKYELRDCIKKKYPFIQECFCFVNVCYSLWKGISFDFVKTYADKYCKSFSMLEDEFSKECAIAYLNTKISGDVDYILPCFEKEESYFENSVFSLGAEEVYVDVGAYTGDSLENFLIAVKGSYRYIYALEPEKSSFKILCHKVEEWELHNVSLFQCGCWNERTKLFLNDDKESSGIGEKRTKGYVITVDSLDNILGDANVSLIKINYLYGLLETLQGAANILRKNKPKLAITVGFDEWAIMKVPQIIKEINRDYRIYLRYGALMPARLMLFAY